VKVSYHLAVGFVGGAERQLQYLIKYARDAYPDYEPSITYDSENIAEFVRSLGVPAVHTKDKKGLIAALNATGPDIFQFYTSPIANKVITYLEKRPRVVEVIHNKNSFPGDTTSYNKSHVDAAICVSHDAARFLLDHFPQAPVRIIPNGIDTIRFYNAGKDLKSKEPVLGFAGRLCPDKGIDMIFRLADQLPCKIELVGQDFAGYSTRNHPKVTVHPPTDKPEEYYRRWWGLLSASPHESFGLSIAEAIACGCMPIMLDCGGITAYLEHGTNALIAAGEEDLLLLARRVVSYQMAPSPIPVKFSAADMATSYMSLYRQLLTNAETAPPPSTQPRPHRVISQPEAAKVFSPIERRPRIAGGVLGITPSGWYGVVRALAGCCDYYATPETAAREIMRLKPKVVILGCYQKSWEELCRVAHNAVGAVVVGTWHAAYVLNEFDPVNRKNMGALFDAWKAGHIDYLATPHRGLARSWTHFGYPTAYFPNLVREDLVPRPKLPGTHIGILGSGQTWKNMECQIIAASMIEGATVHVQEVRDDSILRRFGVDVVVHPKSLNDNDYYDLLGGMTVNMCVSLSEVYSYLVAESLLLKTPVLASAINPIIDCETATRELFATSQFEDPTHMADRLRQLILYAETDLTWLRDHMLWVNAENYEVCAELLERWSCASQS
jgi:glycosyltransferase involved in cell wall biosynthesis